MNKGHLQNTYNITSGIRLNVFPYNGNKANMLLSQLVFNIVLEVLVTVRGKEKEINVIKLKRKK